MNGSSNASFDVSTLAVGDHVITADYDAGDNNFDPALDEELVVGSVDSITTVSASPNPSVYGQDVTIGATVWASNLGAGTPTGTVTFYAGGAMLGSGTLDDTGFASIDVSNLPVGTQTIVAVYGGDSNFTSSVGTTADTVNAGSTTTAVASSPDPSVYGQDVTLAATVAAVSPASGTPTGTVNFYASGTLLGSGTLDGYDDASIDVSALAAGSYSITAVYSGDSNFQLAPARRR